MRGAMELDAPRVLALTAALAVSAGGAILGGTHGVRGGAVSGPAVRVGEEPGLELRIELAADYLVMAAWLAFLKSKLLLPKLETDGEEPNHRLPSAQLSPGDSTCALPKSGEIVPTGNIPHAGR